MKCETELKWLILIYNSKYTKDIINWKITVKSGSKKDFEKLVDASENNIIFRTWFKNMLDYGLFVKSGEIRRGRNNTVSIGYRVDTSKLIKRLKENDLYRPSWKLFNRDRVL